MSSLKLPAAKLEPMIWLHKSPRSSQRTASQSPSLSDTLSYFARFNYPLTPEELWFWQHGSSFSKLKIKKFLTTSYQLPTTNFQIRNQREAFSQKKWLIAQKVADQLKAIPFIEAIFVTGSLAMNNCPRYDDIDFMIVTTPNTLWLTRLLVIFTLGALRRPSRLPEHSSPRVS